MPSDFSGEWSTSAVRGGQGALELLDESQVVARQLLGRALLALGGASERLAVPELSERCRSIAAQVYDLALAVRS